MDEVLDLSFYCKNCISNAYPWLEVSKEYECLQLVVVSVSFKENNLKLPITKVTVVK